MGGPQRETVEEKADALARGKAVASVIGTKASIRLPPSHFSSFFSFRAAMHSIGGNFVLPIELAVRPWEPGSTSS